VLTELAKQFAALDQARGAFLASVRDASAGQQRFRPEPGAWSMLDVTEHLVLAEERTLLGILKGPRPGTRVTSGSHFRMAIVRLVLATGVRVKVPVPTVVPEGTAILTELEGRWEAARRGAAAAFEPITAADAAAARFRHPLTGWVTAREGLGFMIGHIRHHQRQLARIRRAAGFPLP
jgi:uncharacterized damage-inducible protein DinB